MIGLIVLAAIIGSLPAPASAPTPGTSSHAQVQLTQVNWTFTGSSSCWSKVAKPGLSVSGGSLFNVSLDLASPSGSSQATSCTVSAVSLATPGFSLVSVNTPVTVANGSSQLLTVELRAPNQNMSTDLTLAAAVQPGSPPTKVNITGVNWVFSGASNCWSTLVGGGAQAPGGGQVTLTIVLRYTAGLLQPASCTVNAVSVGTSGFTFEGANTPLVVASGGSQTLAVTVAVPNQSETTVLTLDASVSSP